MNYDEFMKIIFWYCVDLMSISAEFFGMTYEELNVWVFMIIQPAIIVCLVFLLIFKNRHVPVHVQSRPAIDPLYFGQIKHNKTAR